MTDELKVKSGSAHWRHKFCTVMTDLSAGLAGRGTTPSFPSWKLQAVNPRCTLKDGQRHQFAWHNGQVGASHVKGDGRCKTSCVHYLQRLYEP
eukprot:s6359_g5.t1